MWHLMLDGNGEQIYSPFGGCFRLNAGHVLTGVNSKSGAQNMSSQLLV